MNLTRSSDIEASRFILGKSTKERRILVCGAPKTGKSTIIGAMLRSDRPLAAVQMSRALDIDAVSDALDPGRLLVVECDKPPAGYKGLVFTVTRTSVQVESVS